MPTRRTLGRQPDRFEAREAGAPLDAACAMLPLVAPHRRAHIDGYSLPLIALAGSMSKTAAGLFLFRLTPSGPEVLLVHLGGPFWVRKDLGAWSLPKGEVAPGEDLLETARREFREETGFDPRGTPFPLGQIRQPGGKVVHAWALEGDFEPGSLKSNTFSVEWPKGSGQRREYPEVDRAEWFDLTEARRRILAAQVPLLDVLAASPRLRQGGPE